MARIEGLSVGGLRGFASDSEFRFAQPNGDPGSGLTIILGSNNSGKSTLVEALKSLSSGRTPTFSDMKRNKSYGDHVDIRATFAGGLSRGVKSIGPGSSQTEPYDETLAANQLDMMVVPSRRGFAPRFSRYDGMTKDIYRQNLTHNSQRAQSMDSAFAGRLFEIERNPKNRSRFDSLLGQIVENLPRWTIDLGEDEQYFIKFTLSASIGSHTSDGVGEGIVSLFSIIDALYNADEQSIVVIDEPELSLHPQYQKRLRSVLSDVSANAQIIFTTHSPYFVDWEDLSRGAEIVRVHKSADGSTSVVSQPDRSIVNEISALRVSTANPHILGLTAREVFFLEDGIILTEGQEDVVYFEKISKSVGRNMNGVFYGFGSGGAGNIIKLMRLLRSLGYEKVVAIYDGDKAEDAAKAKLEFPSFRVEIIPADDIRTKPATAAREEKPGLWTKSGLDPAHRDATIELYESVNAYLAR